MFLCTCLELQPVLRHRVLKCGALGITSVGTVLGGIFSPFRHVHYYTIVLDLVGYSPASDGLDIDCVWGRKQDFDGGIIWMELSNPAPSVFKSSLSGCITSSLFASTRQQQQETLKPHGKGRASMCDNAFAAQPRSMQSGMFPQRTAWPGLEKTPGFFWILKLLLVFDK